MASISTSDGGLLDRVRKPEYTGENRCIPCTVTNLGIAAVVTAGVAYGAVAVGAGAVVAGGLAGAVLLASLASIYLRGYLVPGTPELTKRYFPDWLLAVFDKAEEEPDYEFDEDIDVEAALWDAGVLEERPDGDLGVTDEFASDWWDAVEHAREEERSRLALADIVGVETDGLEFREYGSGAFIAYYDETQVGRWESRAAFLADAAAGKVLPAYYEDWDRADPPVRGQLLAGLRLFLEQCPACDGDVRFGQEMVESCCRSYEVIAVTCDDCGSRLFEIKATPELTGEEAAA